MTQKKSSLSLKINIKCLADKSPEFYVRLNQVELTNKNNQFNGSTVVGSNTLEIIFLNKTDTDTKVDRDGNVLEDLAVIIDSLYVNDVDASNDCKQQGIYTTQDQKIENTNGFLHKNGVFCYKFMCPIFYHLRNRNLIENTST
jgi:hypothetical protein